MSALTRSARGQQCLVRIPNYCNHDPSTVVAAHYRSISLGAGIGFKTDDVLTSYTCSSCHDVIDGRVQSEFSKTEIRLMHCEGVLRTIMHRVNKGQIRIGKSKALETE